MSDLDGVSVLLTGGTRGIGRGIAEVLLRDGARIAITGRSAARARRVAQELAANGGDVIGLEHDAACHSSCARVVAETTEAFSAIDVLVNNAGVSERVGFVDIDEGAWETMLAVNLKSVYLTTKAAIGGMIDRQTGVIVNVASLASKRGLPLFSHYSASKFAVLGLTQALAAEVAPFGVRVNAVCPGVIRTDMWGPELAAVAADHRISVEDAWREAVAEIPLQRPQRVDDIGNAVAFLASRRARSITGESINVNGGQLMD